VRVSPIPFTTSLRLPARITRVTLKVGGRVILESKTHHFIDFALAFSLKAPSFWLMGAPAIGLAVTRAFGLAVPCLSL
jgi:hypothetical protein